MVLVVSVGEATMICLLGSGECMFLLWFVVFNVLHFLNGDSVRVYARVGRGHMGLVSMIHVVSFKMGIAVALYKYVSAHIAVRQTSLAVVRFPHSFPANSKHLDWMMVRFLWCALERWPSYSDIFAHGLFSFMGSLVSLLNNI